ncbi:adhesion G-protein coupled receptor G2 isoform X2 [Megalobrama amblycephala]|uniref:adhesion G-protein coupled receptor G2 isoform X2 n=1 Tax=Megalobrama amblycephala TaxID=75352 RepID=UPI0020143DAA|nr:adhesion G-protein coupled receptor G2 isoform X2 [Megalobrama amblycephala]
MVWCVCADHDVKHRIMSTQLSSREMAKTRLSRRSPLDFVLFLVLLLVCHPVTSINTTTGYPAISLSSATNLTTVTGGTTDNITSAHSPTTERPSNSSTVPLTTSPFTVLNTTMKTTATSSNMSTTIPAMTLTTELHSTDNRTTETTPYTSTGNTTFSETTTISASTGNTTFSETTTISASTGNTTFSETTTNSTSTKNTTFSEMTTISASTGNTTFSETTTISASTGNTTFSETTTNSTSTKNTTFSEMTTISTFTENTTTTNSTFTATPEPSSSANTTDITPPLTTINQTFTTTVTAPTPCQSCSNVFYWMTTSVEVTGTPQSERNVTTQLEELFRRKLDTCAIRAERSISVISLPDMIDANLTTVLSTTVSESSVTEKLSLFEAMELTCDQKNITKNAQCYILLKLRAQLDMCCIINTVMEMNSNIRVRVVGQIERVGVCADNITQISAGQYDKCNQSFNYDVCSAEQPQNITCGNSTNVIFPLNTDAPEVCPTSPPTPTCYCSSHCNGSDFYYYTNISLIGVMDNKESQISHFLYSACQNMTAVCNISKTFISHIQNKRVICENNVKMPFCKIIVKLDTAMDVCDIRTALEAILQPHNDSVIFDGVVSRVAICYNTSSDPLQQALTWQPSLSGNFSSEVFCMESNRENFNEYCSVGNTVIPLNDSCNLFTTPAQNITTTPPSFTSTSLSNTTINSTVIVVSTSVNVTTLPVNVTTLPVNVTTLPVNVTTLPANVTTSGTLDADELLKLSANASSLNATQVDKLLSQLESLLSGPNVSLAVANTSVNIVNNLLDVPVAVITPFSKRAIKVVDTVGLKLVVSGTSQSVLSQSLALGVKKVDGANFQETSFSLAESSNLQIRSNPGKTDAQSRDIVVRVGSTPLGSVTLPASLTQNLTAEQQQLASRVQFNFFQKSTFFQDKLLGSRKLNSGILGSSVANLSISGLQKEVLITLRNTEPIPANYVASCVFWDFSFNGGSGGWNASGCRVLNSSAEETQCACNHLTSFGILLDISKTPIPEEHLNILTYITYIGCGISAIFLSITLLTYLAFGCWIKNDIVFYVAVVGYFCLVFLLNFAMFIVVMIQLCRIKKQNPHNVQNRSGWHEVRSVAGLTVLLGLTWGFAFFAWGPVNLAFMYLFAIFNTLQGFFIFVFHCAMKENVRRQWRTYLCCGKLRLSENSEWSRTATQKINKASKEKISSFHSLNSNNSSLSFLNHDSLAEMQRGIGNPMDDRIITAAEEPVSGSDVVMNEINDRYRGQRSY